jgi:hypothetical protein
MQWMILAAAALVLVLGYVAVVNVGPRDESNVSPPIIPPAGSPPKG